MIESKRRLDQCPLVERLSFVANVLVAFNQSIIDVMATVQRCLLVVDESQSKS